MLRPRIIPCLLIQDSGLVKTVNFNKPKYVGDPINAVRIFNEKEVDELAIFDIDATVLNNEPNYSLIERISNQSRMPLCYGGGIKTIEQAKRIFSLGVEKIALSSSVVDNPNLITQIGDLVGAQSVIVVLDVKKNILFYPSHSPKQFIEIARQCVAENPEINPIFFLLDSSETSAEFDYISYEQVVNHCNFDDGDFDDSIYGINLNEAVLADRLRGIRHRLFAGYPAYGGGDDLYRPARAVRGRGGPHFDIAPVPDV